MGGQCPLANCSILRSFPNIARRLIAGPSSRLAKSAMSLAALQGKTSTSYLIPELLTYQSSQHSCHILRKCHVARDDMLLCGNTGLGISLLHTVHQDSEFTVFTSQSIPSLIPLPSMAEHATILQFLSRSSPKCNASDISPAPFAPG